MFKGVASRALGVFALFTIVCGLGYTLVVTGVAQLAFPYQANGSLIMVDDKVVGSELIGQNFDDEETGFDMRDVAGTETVVQESELTDYNIKDADAGFDDPSVLEDDNSGAEAPAASDEVDF